MNTEDGDLIELHTLLIKIHRISVQIMDLCEKNEEKINGSRQETPEEVDPFS